MLLSAIATAIGAQLDGPDRDVTAVRPLETAGPQDITFLNESRSPPAHLEAAAVIVSGAVPRDRFQPHVSLLRMDQPYLGFARVMSIFHPPPLPSFNGVSAHAFVDPSAHLGQSVRIASGTVVGPGCVLGDRVVLHAGVTLGAGVMVGDDGVLHPRVVIYDRCVLGARVVVHAGTVVGSDGFGFARGPDGAVKIPHAGRVRIEDDVEIGANCAIDRGVLDDTVIGRGAKLDNLVQVGHNVIIGPHCLIAGQAGLAGSCKLGAGVIVGGQVGLAGHISIGAHAQIAGKSGVTRDVPEGARVLGYPATDLHTARRAMAILYQLPELRQHVDRLSRRLDELIADE